MNPHLPCRYACRVCRQRGVDIGLGLFVAVEVQVDLTAQGEKFGKHSRLGSFCKVDGFI